MKAKDIIKAMNKWANPMLIDKWDNTGFQIGNEDKEVDKILIALDLDKKVLEKAINEKFHMIITHHPLIFKPLNSITTNTNHEKLIFNLIKNDIVVYNAHSNLDLADGGVNDVLGNLLGLRNLEILCEISLEGNLDKNHGYGRIGELEEIPLIEYLGIIKEKLDTSNLIVYGDIDRKINKVALCGGSGSDFIVDAYNKGAEIYITGDIKYHDAQLGVDLGLTIVDPGHYHTEKVILPSIKDYLEKEVKENIHIELFDQSYLSYKIY